MGRDIERKRRSRGGLRRDTRDGKLVQAGRRHRDRCARAAGAAVVCGNGLRSRGRQRCRKDADAAGQRGPAGQCGLPTGVAAREGDRSAEAGDGVVVDVLPVTVKENAVPAAIDVGVAVTAKWSRLLAVTKTRAARPRGGARLGGGRLAAGDQVKFAVKSPHAAGRNFRPRGVVKPCGPVSVLEKFYRT